MGENPEGELIASQIKHTVDLLRFEISNLRASQEHFKEMSDHRFAELEECRDDFEGRIRVIKDDVTRSKSIYNLSSAGSTFMSLIALLRTFFL
ncbi:MAG: hypothetical protein ACK2TW_02395 [Anaerolineales bacterium]